MTHWYNRIRAGYRRDPVGMQTESAVNHVYRIGLLSRNVHMDPIYLSSTVAQAVYRTMSASPPAGTPLASRLLALSLTKNNHSVSALSLPMQISRYLGDSFTAGWTHFERRVHSADTPRVTTVTSLVLACSMAEKGAYVHSSFSNS